MRAARRELRFVKYELHPRGMALMYRCTYPKFGSGHCPPIKFVPSYARRRISYLRSKYFTAKLFHLPVRANFITSSLFTVTSYFPKILTKGKRQVKSEEVISKKSSFLRMRIFWRREWDSNPRDVAVKRFSRKLGFVSPRLYL